MANPLPTRPLSSTHGIKNACSGDRKPETSEMDRMPCFAWKSLSRKLQRVSFSRRILPTADVGSAQSDEVPSLLANFFYFCLLHT